MNRSASPMAFGGMMTAVAVVVMCLGSLIPVNTYICPVLCILITKPVMIRCGNRIAWCYYLAAGILSLLLAPDREAAVVYGFLGYYPLIRSRFECIRNSVLRFGAKIIFFTLAGVGAYGLLGFLMGGEALLYELRQGGTMLAAVLILLWDLLLVMVDRLLGLDFGRKRT